MENINTFYSSSPILKNQIDGPETFNQINQYSTKHQFSIGPCDPSDGTPATEGTVAITGRLLNTYGLKAILDEDGNPLVIDLANPIDYQISGRYAEFGYTPTGVDGDYAFVVSGS